MESRAQWPVLRNLLKASPGRQSKLDEIGDDLCGKKEKRVWVKNPRPPEVSTIPWSVSVLGVSEGVEGECAQGVLLRGNGIVWERKDITNSHF